MTFNASCAIMIEAKSVEATGEDSIELMNKRKTGQVSFKLTDQV